MDVLGRKSGGFIGGTRDRPPRAKRMREMSRATNSGGLFGTSREANANEPCQSYYHAMYMF